MPVSEVYNDKKKLSRGLGTENPQIRVTELGAVKYQTVSGWPHEFAGFRDKHMLKGRGYYQVSTQSVAQPNRNRSPVIPLFIDFRAVYFRTDRLMEAESHRPDTQGLPH